MTGCPGRWRPRCRARRSSGLCTWPAPAGLRGLAREAAGLLRALHSWPVPADLAGMLARPAADPDPLRRAGAELVLLPPSSVLGLIPVARQLPFTDHGVLDAAAGRLAELGDPADAGRDVLLHGDFYLGNVLVRDGQVSALIDFEFARLGPPDLELISVVRALGHGDPARRPAAAAAGLAGRGLP